MYHFALLPATNQFSMVHLVVVGWTLAVLSGSILSSTAFCYLKYHTHLLLRVRVCPDIL